MTEDVNSPSLHGGNDLNLVAVTEECDGPRVARDDVAVDGGRDPAGQIGQLGDRLGHGRAVRQSRGSPLSFTWTLIVTRPVR